MDDDSDYVRDMIWTLAISRLEARRIAGAGELLGPSVWSADYGSAMMSQFVGVGTVVVMVWILTWVKSLNTR